MPFVTRMAPGRSAHRATFQPGKNALVPTHGASLDWLDAMILAGRMRIGTTHADQDEVCNAIRAEQAATTP